MRRNQRDTCMINLTKTINLDQTHREGAAQTVFLEPGKVGRAGSTPGMNVPQAFPWPVTWCCLSWRVVGRVLEPWALWTPVWLRATLPHLERLASWCVEYSSCQTSCMAS